MARFCLVAANPPHVGPPIGYTMLIIAQRVTLVLCVPRSDLIKKLIVRNRRCALSPL